MAFCTYFRRTIKTERHASRLCPRISLPSVALASCLNPRLSYAESRSLALTSLLSPYTRYTEYLHFAIASCFSPRTRYTEYLHFAIASCLNPWASSWTWSGRGDAGGDATPFFLLHLFQRIKWIPWAKLNLGPVHCQFHSVHSPLQAGISIKVKLRGIDVTVNLKWLLLGKRHKGDNGPRN